MLNTVRDGLKKVYRNLHSYKEAWKHPYLRVQEPPAERPSIESIYYLINQLGKHSPEGLTHNPSVGYHELPFKDLKFKVSRSDLQTRIGKILSAYDVKGKTGVDFGCAIGGVSFSLQQNGASMLGIDRDLPSLLVARECEALYKTGAKFVHGSISREICEQILKTHHNPQTGKWDFVIWLSSFNWIAKAMGAEGIMSFMQFLSQHSTTLIMDSALGGKGQAFLDELGITTNEEFKNFILKNTSYTQAKNIGVYDSWYGRELFLFQ